MTYYHRFTWAWLKRRHELPIADGIWALIVMLVLFLAPAY